MTPRVTTVTTVTAMTSHVTAAVTVRTEGGRGQGVEIVADEVG